MEREEYSAQFEALFGLSKIDNEGELRAFIDALRADEDHSPLSDTKAWEGIAQRVRQRMRDKGFAGW